MSASLFPCLFTFSAVRLLLDPIADFTASFCRYAYLFGRLVVQGNLAINACKRLASENSQLFNPFLTLPLLNRSPPQGIDVLGESQLVGYPQLGPLEPQFPSVAMLK